MSSFKSRVKYKRKKLELEKLKETNFEEWERLDKKKKAAQAQTRQRNRLKNQKLKETNPEEWKKQAKKTNAQRQHLLDRERKLTLDPEEWEEFLRKRSEREEKKRNA